MWALRAHRSSKHNSQTMMVWINDTLYSQQKTCVFPIDEPFNLYLLSMPRYIRITDNSHLLDCSGYGVDDQAYLLGRISQLEAVIRNLRSSSIVRSVYLVYTNVNVFLLCFINGRTPFNVAGRRDAQDGLPYQSKADCESEMSVHLASTSIAENAAHQGSTHPMSVGNHELMAIPFICNPVSRPGSDFELLLGDSFLNSPGSTGNSSAMNTYGESPSAMDVTDIGQPRTTYFVDCTCSMDASLQVAIHHLRGAVRATVALFKQVHPDSLVQRQCTLLQDILRFGDVLG